MSLTVVSGCMFSGKSEELVRRVKRCIIGGKNIMVFRHSLDTRYHETNMVSHNGSSINATPITNLQDFLKVMATKKGKEVTDIFFDEVQFITDSLFVETFMGIVNSGVNVTVAGLDTTYEAKPFPGIMGELMCVADNIVKLKAVCVQCGADACRSKLFADGERDGECVKIGGSEKYKAVCKKHL